MGRTAAELGQIVRQRRVALGMTQVDVVQAAERVMGAAVFSEPTYRAVETGRTEAGERTLAGISRALDWPADALAKIREGGEVPGDAPSEPRLSAEGESLDALAETDPELYATLQAVVAAARRGQGR